MTTIRQHITAPLTPMPITTARHRLGNALISVLLTSLLTPGAAAASALGSNILANQTTGDVQARADVAVMSSGDFIVVWDGLNDGSGEGVYARIFWADGTPRTPELLVNQTTTNQQTDPAVAVDQADNFAIVWTSTQGATGKDVYARVFDPSGVVATDEIPVEINVGDQFNADVAMDDTGTVIVVWEGAGSEDGNGIYARRYFSLGAVAGVTFPVNPTTATPEDDPQVAASPDGDFVVVWTDRSGGDSAIHTGRFGADGTRQDVFVAQNVAVGEARQAAVAMDHKGDFVIVWGEKNADASQSGVRYRRFRADGAPLTGDVLVNTASASDQLDPAVASDGDGDFVIAWTSIDQDGDAAGVVTRRYDADGASASNESVVNSHTTADQHSAQIHVNDSGVYVIVWEGQSADDPAGVLAQRFSASIGSVCGNGDVDPGEECDDGNALAGDCCRADCTFATVGAACTDDGNACTDDACDVAGACTHVDNTAPCDDGSYCNGADSCSGGSCAVHAGDPCLGADGDADCAESCDEANDGCIATDLDGSPCDDGSFCNGADSCSAGTCSVHAGDPCPGPDGDGDCTESCNEISDACNGKDPASSACDDGLYCNGADSCDGAGGSCSIHTGDPCGGADGDGNCAESCDEAADGCTAADLDGAACDDGLFCNGPDTCSAGACTPTSGNPCPGSDGDGDCAESCDEASDSCSATDPDGAACDDGTFCNGPDTCSAGACSVSAGNPCIGDPQCGGVCNEGSDDCGASEGAPCDDGLFCNGADTCVGGTCDGHAGDPCPGSNGDGNCAESCNEATDGCAAPDPDGAPCDDGTFCNGSDACSAGACTVHAGDPCPGPDGDGDCAESCDETGDSCNLSDADGAACDDGTFCNGADTCNAATCNGHAGDPCPGPDGDGDCTESCNEVADSCSASDANGTPCDDALFCNGADTCTFGSCNGHSGNPCSGPDGDGDCSESCDEAADSCSAADFDGAACDDGAFCNGLDTCGAGACAVHDGNPCPGPDGDGDCAESCDEGSDVCTAADLDGSGCNDGVFCNGSDLCNAGGCSVHGGDPCAGPDGDANCTESCDEAADRCSGADADGAACDDGVYCNGADTCGGGNCGVSAGDPCPGPDADTICTESCDEATDACTLPDPDGAACDDGIFCNGADICDAGTCSVSAGDPCSGPDGDLACAESCNETDDDCLAPDPDGALCDDGLFCNGVDACAAGICAGHTGDPCIAGGQCDNLCDDALDTCNLPDGTPCDDGLFCTLNDACAAGSCTSAENPCGTTPTCTNTCNEDEQVCKGCGEPYSSSSCVPNAVVAIRAAVGIDSCEPCLCDVDGSGSVAVTDALRILSYCIGVPLALDQCPEIDLLLLGGSTTTSIPAGSTTSTTSTTLPFP